MLDVTGRLMTPLDSAGAIANENILLHTRAARSDVGSLNDTAAIVEDFHVRLGIEANRSSVDAIPWREALGDSAQRRIAGKEAGQRQRCSSLVSSSALTRCVRSVAGRAASRKWRHGWSPLTSAR